MTDERAAPPAEPVAPPSPTSSTQTTDPVNLTPSSPKPPAPLTGAGSSVAGSAASEPPEASPEEISTEPMLDGDLPEAVAHSGTGGQAPNWFRPVLAWVMIAVATLGAFTAYRAAEVEHDTAQITLRLTLGQMFEVARWSEYAHEYGASIELDSRQREHNSLGRQFAARADEIRTNDPAEAFQLDARAQEEFTLGRIFNSFRYFMKEPGNDFLKSLATQVTLDLKELGFNDSELKSPVRAGAAQTTSLVAPTEQEGRQREELSVWPPLKQKREQAHTKVLKLVGIVACFVLSLVLFTLADLFLHRPQTAKILGLIGLIIASASAVFAAVTDPDGVWPILGICAIASAFLALTLWRPEVPPDEKAEWLYPKEIKWELFRGPHLVLKPHTNEGISRWAIFLIAFTVFLSALVGFLYSHAAVERDHMAQQAFDEQTAFAKQIVQSSFVATGSVFEPAIARISQEARCAASIHRQMTSAQTTDRKREKERAAACLGLDLRSAAANILSDIYGGLNSEFSPAKYLPNDVTRAGATFDTDYSPSRLLYHAAFYGIQENPARLYALVDGYQELSVGWNRKATVYLANLTLLAIALYFFGQALGVTEAKQARNFFVIGALFTIGAIGWSAMTFAARDEPAVLDTVRAKTIEGCERAVDLVSPRHRSPDWLVRLAARHYGNGEAQRRIASSLPSDIAHHVYKKSAESLECALAARPAFARAFFELKRTYSEMGNAQRDERYPSLPTRSKIDNIVRAQEKAFAAFNARELAPPDEVLPRNGAFARILLALQKTDRDAAKESLKTAVRDIRNYLAADELELSLPENRKSALKEIRIPQNAILYVNLALGFLAEDRVAEAEKVYRIAIEDLRISDNWDLVLATLTDLNLFVRYCPRVLALDRCEEIGKIVPSLKQNLVAGRWQDRQSTGAVLHDVSITVSPSTIGWRGKLDPGAAPGKLTVVWYVRDAPPAEAENDWDVWRAMPGLSKTTNLAKIARAADGSVVVAERYSGGRACLTRGRYMAEFYLDGILLPNLNLAPVDVDFETYRSRGMNLVFCAPKNWSAVSEGPELVRTYAERRGDLTLNRMLVGTLYATRDKGAVELKRRYALALIDGLRRKATTTPDNSPVAECGASPPEGAYLYKAWVTGEGVIHVAITYPDVPVKDACVVLESVDNYLPPLILGDQAAASAKP
jgi:tetratricopeptide (TPR) repeat protein